MSRLHEYFEKDKLDEAKTDINKLADVMTRIIIGDQQQGLNQLKKLLPIRAISFSAGEEYNREYDSLFINIKNAISPYIK